jgi:transcriptional regulator with XRE-family HTH domain
VTVAVEANPTVARRRLAVYLNRLREQHGYDLNKLAGVLEVNLSQASRLDTGARGFRVQDVGTLCRLYGIDSQEEARLVALAAESRKRAWWQQVYLPDAVRTLIGMEQAAVSINEFAGSVIPGLLQTREYAEAAARAVVGLDIAPHQLRAAIDARMRRQEVLDRADPPELWVVMDEAVLARGAGGRDVMCRQLERVHQAAERHRVTVQVIAFEQGLYALSSQHVQILEMGGELPDVVYTEDNLHHVDKSDEKVLRSTRRLWDRLRALALSPRESATVIERYIDDLRSGPPITER